MLRDGERTHFPLYPLHSRRQVTKHAGANRWVSDTGVGRCGIGMKCSRLIARVGAATWDGCASGHRAGRAGRAVGCDVYCKSQRRGLSFLFQSSGLSSWTWWGHVGLWETGTAVVQHLSQFEKTRGSHVFRFSELRFVATLETSVWVVLRASARASLFSTSLAPFGIIDCFVFHMFFVCRRRSQNVCFFVMCGGSADHLIATP